MKTSTRLGLSLAFGLRLWPLHAFDWQPQPVETLRRDCAAEASKAAATFAGQRFGQDLSAFATEVQTCGDLTTWITNTASFCRAQLDAYPPSETHAQIRQSLFRLLDYPLHIDNYDAQTPRAAADVFVSAVRVQFDTAKNRVLTELTSQTASEGAAVWKLYNMGFVVKTRLHAFAIDIASGPRVCATPPPAIKGDPRSPENRATIEAWRDEIDRMPPVWTDAEIDRLTDALDALFITHPHGDHYHPAIVCAMLRKRKPVVAPFDWTASRMGALAPRFDELRPAIESCFLSRTDTGDTPVDVAGLRVAMLAGHQDKSTPNTVYWIESDGVRIVHNGDNCERGAEARLSNLPAAPIIFANCWSGLPAFVSAVAPTTGAAAVRQTVIPGHENEMGHGVSHRESWRELYSRTDRLAGLPPSAHVLVLGWGEKWAYAPGR